MRKGMTSLKLKLMMMMKEEKGYILERKWLGLIIYTLIVHLMLISIILMTILNKNKRFEETLLKWWAS